MDDSFILGLIAGEGSFSSALFSQNDTVYVYPIFQLKLSDVDCEIVEGLEERFGVGTVNYDNSGNVGWHVRGADDVDALITFIEESDCKMFEMTAKYKQYLRWLELVEKKRQSDGTDAEKAEMIRTARSVTDSNLGSGRSAEEWIAEL